MSHQFLAMPKQYAELAKALYQEEQHTAEDSFTFNFSSEDTGQEIPLLNPPSWIRLIQDKSRLYPWLYRHHLSLLTPVRARHEGPWPLWALQSEPYLCRNAEEALAGSAEYFAAPPKAPRDSEEAPRLWRFWHAGGQIVSTELHEAGRWQVRHNEAWQRVFCESLYSLTGGELFISHVLEMQQTCHILDLSLPEQIPEHLFSSIVAALRASLQRATEMWHRGRLQSWQIIALFEPILQCSFAPQDLFPWRWEIAPQNEEIRPRLSLRLEGDAAIAAEMPESILRSVQSQLRIVQRRPWHGPWLLPQDEPSDPTRLLLHPKKWREIAARNWELSRGSSQIQTRAGQKKLLFSRYSLVSQQPALPLLGVLTFAPREQGDPFAFEGLHFRQLAELAQGHGLQVMIFSDEDLILQQNRCWGYELVEGNWKRACFPLPDILYIRGGASSTMTPEQERRRLGIIRSLIKRGVPTLNNLEFMALTGDKKRLHRFLGSLPACAEHLPETVPFSERNLRIMLQRHNTLFLKPKTGYEARGILCLAWNAETELFTCHYNSKEGQLNHWNELSYKELLRRLDALMLTGYIIQQGLQPGRWHDSLFELRLIMQLNRGQPQLMGQVVRLSGRENLPIITALREQWQPATAVLDECCPKNSEALLAHAKHLAFLLAAEFNQPPYQASEFSLDFIVDQECRLWILEANAKPASFFVQIGDDDARRASLAAKLEQARWLLEQTKP